MKTLITRFRSFCVSSFPLVAFALVVSNFIVSCSVSRASRPQYHYKTFVITNVVSSVVTNYVSSSFLPSSIPSNALPESVEQPPPPRYDGSYKYFVLESRRMAYMDGTYYREGDVCSRGIILRIFPDCIYLHNGSVIDNKYQVRMDGERSSPFSSPPPPETFKTRSRRK